MYRIKNGYSFYSNGGISLKWELGGRVFYDLSQQVSVKLSQYDRKGGQEPPLSAVKSDEWRFKNTETRCQM